MRQLYRMYCYNMHNILVAIAIHRIAISTNLYPSRSNITFRNTSIAISPILVKFWGSYRSIGLYCFFSMVRFWHPYFGIRTVFYSLFTLRKNLDLPIFLTHAVHISITGTTLLKMFLIVQYFNVIVLPKFNVKLQSRYCELLSQNF